MFSIQPRMCSHYVTLQVTMASVTVRLIVPTATKINESSWVAPAPSVPPSPAGLSWKPTENQKYPH